MHRCSVQCRTEKSTPPGPSTQASRSTCSSKLRCAARLSLRTSGSSSLFLASIPVLGNFHPALHYSRACLPGLPTLHRAVQVITLEVSGPLRALDKNGLNLTFASKFPKVHFVQEVQSSPSVAIDPCTPRHLAF